MIFCSFFSPPQLCTLKLCGGTKQIVPTNPPVQKKKLGERSCWHRFFYYSQASLPSRRSLACVWAGYYCNVPGASQSWHVAIGEKVRRKLFLRGFSSPPSVASRPVCVCPPQPPSFPTFVCTVSGRGGANERPCSSVTLSSAGYYSLGGSLFGRRRGGRKGGKS